MLNPSILKQTILMILFSLSFCEIAYAQLRLFPSLENSSFGEDAINSEKRKAIFFDLQTVLIDGQKKSFPPDITTFDRSLIADARVGYNHAAGGKIGARFIAAAQGIIRKEHTEVEPRSVITEDGLLYKPSIDIILTTNSGIDVNIGAQYIFMPEYFGRTETPSITANTRYAEISLMQPRIAMIKRGGFGQGGFYYKQGVEAVRDVEVSFEDVEEDPRLTKEVMRFPTTIGIIMKFNAAGSIWLAEFQAVQAGEGGERKEDTNKTIQEDYNTIKIGWGRKLALFEIDTSLKHKTLSYATSEDTRLDLTPMYILQTKLKAGSKDSYVYAGLIYAYAKDLQSEEEFNQKFLISGYGASAGFRLSL